MKVKVCGMRDADNIRKVEGLGIDMMGFIFWPKSSRYVSERPAYLPTKCKRIGVFVDQPIEEVAQIARDYALDYIQLHGHESPDFIRQLRSLCGDSIATIKAFNIATEEDFKATAPYEDIVDCVLFDTKGKSVGGNGEKFDWSVLSSYEGQTPFLLSGGIGPDDVNSIKAFFSVDNPSVAAKCIGIDLNSRFETSPGMKDVHALRSFLSQLNH